MQKQVTGIHCSSRNNCVAITATYPDGETNSIVIFAEELKEIYSLPPHKFRDLFGDNEKELIALYNEKNDNKSLEF